MDKTAETQGGGTLTTTATVGTMINPMGAGLGVCGQLSTDLMQGEISSPESYTGAVFGGAIGMEGESAMTAAAVATSTREMLENANGVNKHNPRQILQDTAVTGMTAWGTHIAESGVDRYLKIGLTECERGWVESILSGAANGIYYNSRKKANLD